MKKLLFFIFAINITVVAKDVYVNEYYNKKGDYVSSHYRSSSNNTKSDNWTTKGNKNPYTYKKGTKEYYNYSNYGYSKKKK